MNGALLIALILVRFMWADRGSYTSFVFVLAFAVFYWTWCNIRPESQRVGILKVTIREVFRFSPALMWAFFAYRSGLVDVSLKFGGWVSEERVCQLGGFLSCVTLLLTWKIRSWNGLKMGFDLIGPFTLVVIAAFGIAVMVPVLSPAPHIDVFVNNTLAIQHFLAGKNVYTEVYPDIYGGLFDYKPGFLYLPGTLLTLIPGYVLLGDLRYSLWFCLVLTAISVFLWLRKEGVRSPWAMHVTLFLISIPSMHFVLEQAWVDSILVAASVISILSAQRDKLLISALSCGWMLSSKQYGFLLPAFLFPFLLREWGKARALRWAAISVVTAAIVVLPFVFADPKAFFEMTVGSHAKAGNRADALNLTAFFIRTLNWEIPGVLQVLASVTGMAVGGWIVWRAKKGEWHCVPWAMANAFLLSILFGKFAFCNYYYLLVSWIALGTLLFVQLRRVEGSRAAVETVRG